MEEMDVYWVYTRKSQSLRERVGDHDMVSSQATWDIQEIEEATNKKKIDKQTRQETAVAGANV